MGTRLSVKLYPPPTSRGSGIGFMTYYLVHSEEWVGSGEVIKVDIEDIVAIAEDTSEAGRRGGHDVECDLTRILEGARVLVHEGSDEVEQRTGDPQLPCRVLADAECVCTCEESQMEFTMNA